MKSFLAMACVVTMSAFAAEPEKTLEDGTYSFKLVAHKQGGEETMDGPPVDCALKRTGQSFSLTPVTNMEWTVSGSISNETVQLEFHREHLDDWRKRGYRFEHEGTIVGRNHAVGKHRGFAGTNMYVQGTWELTKIESRAEPGTAANGLTCRLTPDKTEYAIGETVHVLVEITNNTDKPVALGLEPLIEIKHASGSSLSRQPAELHMTFSQGSNAFFATYHMTFPRGIDSEAKAVTLAPKDTFTETVHVTPWGPTLSSIPSTAQSGKMTLTGSLWQFLSPDLKKTQVQAGEVAFSLKAESVSTSSVPSAEPDPATMKPGVGIGHQLRDMKAFPKVEPPGEKPAGHHLDVAAWKVGPGILSVSHSMGAGIIRDMTYTVPADGEKRAVFKVKEFDPKTGELTIMPDQK